MKELIRRIPLFSRCFRYWNVNLSVFLTGNIWHLISFPVLRLVSARSDQLFCFINLTIARQTLRVSITHFGKERSAGCVNKRRFFIQWQMTHIWCIFKWTIIKSPRSLYSLPHLHILCLVRKNKLHALTDANEQRVCQRENCWLLTSVAVTECYCSWICVKKAQQTSCEGKTCPWRQHCEEAEKNKTPNRRNFN